MTDIKSGPEPDVEKRIKALGRQVTIEYHQCSRKVLLSREAVEQAMLRAAKVSGATVVSASFHEFEPQGVSGVVIIAESHLTVHAWPEYRYAAVDIFTCGSHHIFEPAIEALKQAFQSGKMMISSDLSRGFMPEEPNPHEKIAQKPADDLEVRLVKTVPVDVLITLYKEAGWWDGNSSNIEFLRRLAMDSALFAAAFVNGKMVGMGRALSDLVSDAYIQDVTVLKAYRGHGIGEKIIQTLIDGLKRNGVDWIGLVAEPGTFEFYEKLGFNKLEGYLPLKLGSKET